MISVTRKAHFNAAHRLHNPNWSSKKNKEFYGLCNNKNYHGHNYDLEVTVTGEIDKDFISIRYPDSLSISPVTVTSKS